MAQRLQMTWQQDQETLERLYKQEKDYQSRTRLQALWLLRQDRAMAEVASIVGVHYRTLQEWIAWYRRGGTAEVLAHRHGGHGGGERGLAPPPGGAPKGKRGAGGVSA